jgi:hypothetical protein
MDYNIAFLTTTFFEDEKTLFIERVYDNQQVYLDLYTNINEIKSYISEKNYHNYPKCFPVKKNSIVLILEYSIPFIVENFKTVYFAKVFYKNKLLYLFNHYLAPISNKEIIFKTNSEIAQIIFDKKNAAKNKK